MHHFCPVFNCILQLLGNNYRRHTGTLVGPVIPDNRVKVGDPRLNLSREILPETV